MGIYKMKDKESNVYEDFLDQLKGKIPKKPTVSVWNTRSTCGLPKKATKLKDYYNNVEIKLAAQLTPLELFDDTLILPGVWPDYGVALEASAFGCEVKFFENDPPQALPFMKDYSEINSLKIINPKKDGLMPRALEEYKFILKNIPSKFIKKIDYLDGCVVTAGPLEVSSMIMGHELFYLGFYNAPYLIKKLLDIVTEGICKWLNELKLVSGRIKIYSMIEHLPGQISREHFIEYGYPYIKQIFDESNANIKLYHNEDNINHINDYISKLGIDIFHFGDIGGLSIKELISKIGDSIVVMGNVSPLEVLLKGNKEDVRKASLQCIREGKNRLLLSSGGGMAPDTPKENIGAMINAARKD
jgi:uroporphyrinogen decarboxylase